MVLAKMRKIFPLMFYTLERQLLILTEELILLPHLDLMMFFLNHLDRLPTLTTVAALLRKKLLSKESEQLGLNAIAGHQIASTSVFICLAGQKLQKIQPARLFK